jgi:hypothetical protein
VNIQNSFHDSYSYSTKDTCQNTVACLSKTFTYYQDLTTMIYTDESGTRVCVFLVCKTTDLICSVRFILSKITRRNIYENIEKKKRMKIVDLCIFAVFVFISYKHICCYLEKIIKVLFFFSIIICC